MARAAALPALLLFSLLLSSAVAHNITKILSQYPDYSSFSDILAQTGLDAEINRRDTITVLVVANSELDAVSGRPLDIVKKIVSVHVILDYFDSDKLAKLSKKTALLTTLFQTTGLAAGQSGFVNVTDLPDGKVAFGSAVHGAGLDVYLVKRIAAQPYNISVLEVSSLIVPPGIESNTPPAAATPSAEPKKAESPTTTTPAAAPEASTKAAAAPSKAAAATSKAAEAPSETAAAPSKAAAAPTKATPAPSNSIAAPSSDDATAEGPAESDDDTASAPAEAPVTAADAPSDVLVDAPAGGPAGNLAADGAEGPSTSSATRVAVSAGLAVGIAAALLSAF